MAKKIEYIGTVRRGTQLHEFIKFLWFIYGSGISYEVKLGDKVKVTIELIKQDKSDAKKARWLDCFNGRGDCGRDKRIGGETMSRCKDCGLRIRSKGHDKGEHHLSRTKKSETKEEKTEKKP